MAGIVALPEHYLYSSAVNYAGNAGVLEVEWMGCDGACSSAVGGGFVNRSVFRSSLSGDRGIGVPVRDTGRAMMFFVGGRLGASGIVPNSGSEKMLECTLS